MAGSALQQFIDALHRRGAALEDVHHPAHGDDGPDELQHVSVEADEIANRDAVLNHQMAAGQQRNHHGDAEDEFERGPQHAHQLHQPQRARNVLAVELLEPADLGFFARKRANQPRAGVVLLRLRRNIGEACLDAFEAIVDLAPEVLHQDAGDGHGRQRHQR